MLDAFFSLIFFKILNQSKTDTQRIIFPSLLHFILKFQYK